MKTKLIKPKSVEEVEKYLTAPECHNSVVLFQEKGLMFMLNPFGGGVCNTQELKLNSDFKVDESKIQNISIIIYKKQVSQ
jgi:hypothetical protein